MNGFPGYSTKGVHFHVCPNSPEPRLLPLHFPGAKHRRSIWSLGPPRNGAAPFPAVDPEPFFWPRIQGSGAQVRAALGRSMRWTTRRQTTRPGMQQLLAARLKWCGFLELSPWAAKSNINMLGSLIWKAPLEEPIK